MSGHLEGSRFLSVACQWWGLLVLLNVLALHDGLAFSVTGGVGFVYAVGEVDNFGELDDSSLGTS